MKPNFLRIIQIALILICVVVLLFPSSPRFNSFPQPDAGLFLTIGRQIAEGGTMYRDVWDHKPPLHMYLNALGYLLGGGTPWGIWILQVLLTTAGLWITLDMLTREYDPFVAMLGVGAVLIGGYTLWAGNVITEFGLPFQMAVVGLYLHARRTDYPLRDGILLGLASGLLLLLKQPLIMLVVVVGVLLIMDWILDTERRPVIMRFILTTNAAGLATLGLVALYFASQGVLADAIDAAFVYNTYYAGVIDSGSLFNSIFRGGSLYAPTGLHVALIGVWLGTFIHLLISRKFNAIDPVGRVLLLAIPLEITATSLTRSNGTAYDHYFLSWLPVLGMSAAYLFAKLQSLSADLSLLDSWFRLAVTLVAIGSLPFLHFYETVRNPPPAGMPQSVQPALDLIDQYSAPDDTLLVWGYTPAFYYVTGHESPTRFVFPFGIFMPGFSSEELQAEYVTDVLSNPPAVIVDTGKGVGCLPSLDAQKRAAQVLDPATCYISGELERLFDFVTENYELAATLDDTFGKGDYYVLISDAAR